MDQQEVLQKCTNLHFFQGFELFHYKQRLKSEKINLLYIPKHLKKIGFWRKPWFFKYATRGNIFWSIVVGDQE